MSTKRYFDILGIPPTKNETLIKKAYRKKALKYHPDRNSSAAAKDKFIEVTEAYDRLLLALERGENLTSKTQSSSRRQPPTQHSAPKRKTASEIREERVKEAQKRYENMKRREEQEDERYFQSITNGKVWRRFKTIMYACTIISLLTILDLFVFPTQTDLSQITNKNERISYSGAGGSSTSPVIFKNGQKAWISLPFIEMENENYLYLERTMLFKEIKYVKIWQNNDWQKYVPDYSLVSTFPLIPLILLIPLFTFYAKSRTYTFTLLFHMSLYTLPTFLLFFLLSNDRWTYLLTLGLM